MKFIAAFFAAFLYVSFTQNLVFTGGYGASEAIRSAARPKQIMLFSIMIAYFSTVTSLICRVLLFIPALKDGSMITSLAVYAVVLTVVYFVSVAILRVLLKSSDWSDIEIEKFFRQTAVSSFNTIVLAIPFITEKATYGVHEAIAQGLGAGVAFFIATWLIYLGMRRLEVDTETPLSFKGTPVLFMYIAILCLAFTGIMGKSLFF
ncbi:MAG: hypothetical protein II473_02225 [Clostridia bacterium]|jgi:Na+-translocating ferredoxin:NAD+ oxidoreductase RnfA subunit|nr:hypothetical protein [Clostridia bacterium]MBQ1895978.1 hypothetical protein [Clostridia bacterium]MBQ2091988.1 hypothetical protein [Clostridia bacterium]MBQ2499968.1 hypothetical protein [Clostridia bacterium]